MATIRADNQRPSFRRTEPESFTRKAAEKSERKNDMKKILAAILALCLILSMAACNVNVKSTETFTTTTTDSNGNTTTTTTTTTNDNGTVSETTETVSTTAEEAAAAQNAGTYVSCAALAEDGEIHSFPFKVENMTDENIVAFYTTPVGGDIANSTNIIEGGVLAPGSNVHGDFSYNKENLIFDFVFYFNETEFVRISQIDFSGLRADTDGIVLQLVHTEQDTYKIVAA